MDLTEILEKAEKLALFVVKNREDKSITTREMKQFGLPSRISTAIFQKYKAKKYAYREGFSDILFNIPGSVLALKSDNKEDMTSVYYYVGFDLELTIFRPEGYRRLMSIGVDKENFYGNFRVELPEEPKFSLGVKINPDGTLLAYNQRERYFSSVLPKTFFNEKSTPYQKKNAIHRHLTAGICWNAIFHNRALP